MAIAYAGESQHFKTSSASTVLSGTITAGSGGSSTTFVAVVFGNSASSALTSITLTNVTWTNYTFWESNSGEWEVWIGYATGTPGTSLTINNSVSCTMDAQIMQFTGIPIQSSPVSPVENFWFAYTTPGTASATLQASSTAQYSTNGGLGIVAYAAAIDGSSPTITFPSGYTGATFTGVSGSNGWGAGYVIKSAGGGALPTNISITSGVDVVYAWTVAVFISGATTPALIPTGGLSYLNTLIEVIYYSSTSSSSSGSVTQTNMTWTKLAAATPIQSGSNYFHLEVWYGAYSGSAPTAPGATPTLNSGALGKQYSMFGLDSLANVLENNASYTSGATSGTGITVSNVVVNTVGDMVLNLAYMNASISGLSFPNTANGNYTTNNEQITSTVFAYETYIAPSSGTSNVLWSWTTSALNVALSVVLKGPGNYHLTQTFSETATITETFKDKAIRTLKESALTITENFAHKRIKKLTDAQAPSESIKRAISIKPSDAITVIGSIATHRVLFATESDVVTFSTSETFDAQDIHSKSFSDSDTPVESTTRNHGRSRSMSDLDSPSDLILTNFGYTTVLLDDVSESDGIGFGYGRLQAELISCSDSAALSPAKNLTDAWLFLPNPWLLGSTCLGGSPLGVWNPESMSALEIASSTAEYSDPVTLVEAQSSLIARRLSESQLAISDSSINYHGVVTSFSDAVSLASSLVSLLSHYLTKSDHATLSEAALILRQGFQHGAEVIDIVFQNDLVVIKNPVDQITVDEAVSRYLSRIFKDSDSLEEDFQTIHRVEIPQVTTADTLFIVDYYEDLLSMSFSAAVSLVEKFKLAPSKQLSESDAPVESFSEFHGQFTHLTDHDSLAESFFAEYDPIFYEVSFTTAVGLTETIIVAVGRHLAESIAQADSVRKLVTAPQSETGSLTESFTPQQGTGDFFEHWSDSLSMSDSASEARGLQFQETTILSEVAFRRVHGHLGVLSSTLSMSDSASELLHARAGFSDDLSPEDAFAAASTLGLSDPSVPVETFKFDLSITFGDHDSLSDSFSGFRQYGFSAGESGTVTEDYADRKQLARKFSESLPLSDYESIAPGDEGTGWFEGKRQYENRRR
jgi:hypothetical protein